MTKIVAKLSSVVWPTLVLLTLASLTRSGLASADPREGDLATRFPVHDEDPSGYIPTEEERNADPLEFGYFLQDLSARAETAFQKKDHVEAAKYYEAVAKAVPTAQISFQKLCRSYIALDDVEKATERCFQALTHDTALVRDYTRYLNVAMRKATLTPQDRTNIEATLRHLRAQAANPGANLAAAANREAVRKLQDSALAARGVNAPTVAGEQAPGTTTGAIPKLATQVEILACKYAARIGDQVALETCTAALGAEGNDARLAFPFEWSLALLRQDRARSEALLTRAAELGIKPDVVDRMRVEFAKGPEVQAVPTNAPEEPLGPELDSPERASGLAALNGNENAAPRRAAPGALIWVMLAAVAVGLGLVAFLRQRRRADA